MNLHEHPPFSPKLQSKIDSIISRDHRCQLGAIHFSSPFLLAPMAGITSAPFRLLLQRLGCGGSVSELISCHAINYGNQKTMGMIATHPQERSVGIQLFGEDGAGMARAARTVEEQSSPQFIDINMGCPVKKVVGKGAGSAMLKETGRLPHFFREVRRAIQLPLTIKIRTGWDQESLNAEEVIKIAQGEGIEMVAIHGRTRAQQYTGYADWDYLESVAKESPLPIIGNGDLNNPVQVAKRWRESACQALMIGRGALRNPFIFLETLEALQDVEERTQFSASDTWEVVQYYHHLLRELSHSEKTVMVQLRKSILWMAAGFPHASKLRGTIFQLPSIDDLLKYTEDYFLSLGDRSKNINFSTPFMTSGHG